MNILSFFQPPIFGELSTILPAAAWDQNTSCAHVVVLSFSAFRTISDKDWTPKKRNPKLKRSNPSPGEMIISIGE